MSASPKHKRRGRPRRSSEVPLAGSRALDHNSAVPLYYQLAEALKQALEAGAWEADARFPTEREISEVFEVSRTVIRPALELLAGDGAIYRVRGKGTFVAPPKREIPVVGLVRAIADGIGDFTISVLEAQRRAPDRMVTHFLQLGDQDTAVANVTALIHFEGQAICYLDSYFLIPHVPWLLPNAEALANGAKPPKGGDIDLTRADAWLEGSYLGQFAASHFGARAGEPALLGRLVQFGIPKGARRELPLEFARMISPSDSTQLVFETD